MTASQLIIVSLILDSDFCRQRAFKHLKLVTDQALRMFSKQL